MVKSGHRDNGNGIPKQSQQAVFEPYFTTRRESGGSGLGLATVNSLTTNKLKGTLGLDSEKGAGVEFTYRLPLEIAPPKRKYC